MANRPCSLGRIKKKAVKNPVTATILDINQTQNKEILSGAKIEIFTSTDSVGAPIFYRAVPLPFRYATIHLDKNGNDTHHLFSSNISG